MYKLRQTWVDIMHNKRLYALDVAVHNVDPAWPITATAPEQGVIHVNPKFLKVCARLVRNASVYVFDINSFNVLICF